MKTTLHTEWTVGDLCKGFIYDKNENKGLSGTQNAEIPDIVLSLCEKRRFSHVFHNISDNTAGKYDRF